jgi:hypothetical protein
MWIFSSHQANKTNTTSIAPVSVKKKETVGSTYTCAAVQKVDLFGSKIDPNFQCEFAPSPVLFTVSGKRNPYVSCPKRWMPLLLVALLKSNLFLTFSQHFKAHIKLSDLRGGLRNYEESG